MEISHKKNYKILVVNDGSKDNTLEVAQSCNVEALQHIKVKEKKTALKGSGSGGSLF